MSSVVSIVLCGVYCGVHKPVKSSKNTSYLCESQQLNDKSASFWYYQPHSDISSLILIFSASFWFFLFLIDTMTSVDFFFFNFFLFQRSNKNYCSSFGFSPSFFRNWFQFFKNYNFTIMSTSTLVRSCTDSVPSIHIRWAILTDISWNKFKNNMVFTWKPHGIYIETIWCPPGNHVVTTLCQHGNHMVSIWKPCFVHIETMWFSYGNHMVSTFDTLWWPPGNHMVCTW